MLLTWRHMGRNARIVSLAMILWAIGEGLWWHIQPLYLASLGASPEQTGFILALAGLARLAIMLPAGILGDQYGARRIMLPGWFLGALGVLTIAIAPDFYVLTLGFVFYGLSNMAMPMINLYLVQSLRIDPTVKSFISPRRVLTFVYALYWLGMIISPTAGGFIADWISLRAVFWVSFFWFLLSTVVIFQTEFYPLPLRSRMPARERLKKYRQLITQRNMLLPYIVFSLGFITTVIGYTFMPRYLDEVYDLSTGSIGLLSSGLVAGSFIWNLILGQQGEWQSFLAAVFLPGVAALLLISSDEIILLLLAYFLMGAFEALRPVATGIIAPRTDEEHQGVAFSLVDMLHGVGLFVAPAMAGIFYARQPEMPFVIALGLTPFVLIGVLIVLRYGNATDTTPVSSSSGTG